MEGMKVILVLSDNRIVVITSDKGSYNKIKYDCFLKSPCMNNSPKINGKTLEMVVIYKVDLTERRNWNLLRFSERFI